jgi:hypothetical protein
VAVAENDREQVVEVVRDTACEVADSLHLLSLTKQVLCFRARRFRLPSLGILALEIRIETRAIQSHGRATSELHDQSHVGRFEPTRRSRNQSQHADPLLSRHQRHDDRAPRTQSAKPFGLSLVLAP